MAKADITVERLREALHYDPETGLFTWLVRQGVARPGDKAGTSNGSRNGVTYLRVRIDGKSYLCHRLAWLYMTGYWPTGQVDHKIGHGNVWSNLRDVTAIVNQQNQRRPRRDNQIGLMGVAKANQKWKALITINKQRKYLGVFDTPEQAAAAYLDAKRLFHDGCTI